MNILFISPNSPKESVGGIERYITNLINYYKDRSDAGVYLILPTTGETKVEQEGSVTIYYDKSFSVPRQPERHKKQITKNARVFSTLVEIIIKDKKIDIICAENLAIGTPAIYSLLLNMIASQYQILLVLRLHSFPVTELQKELVNQLMWSRVSCVSKSVAGDCFQKGTDIDILSTDYLGVNTSEFTDGKVGKGLLKKELGMNDNAKIILTATRIIAGSFTILREKGVINLIKAFSKMHTRYPSWRLLIAVGIPPESLKNEFEQSLEMLMGYIKLHGIEKQAIVKTFPLEDMPKVYKESDVFVLTSENETFGQVFIEAMSCGIPVIGTKVGGIPEIISDSYNGYLVQPDDASILAQRIEKLMNDTDLRGKFIKGGIKTVKSNFTAERQFAEFHAMLAATAIDHS
ncbi:MAG: glycosyltransferase family 4 protein [Candidatus Gottesmanbacteria bacterium]